MSEGLTSEHSNEAPHIRREDIAPNIRLLMIDKKFMLFLYTAILLKIECSQAEHLITCSYHAPKSDKEGMDSSADRTASLAKSPSACQPYVTRR